jgi:hypothetical protein
MKKLLFISVLSLFLNSCSEDDRGELNTSNILIKKIISSDLIYNYSYIGSKLVEITMNNGNVSKYTYSGDNISSIKNYYNGVVFYQTHFQYDSNHRVTSQLEYYMSNNIVAAERTDFTYNLNNIISFQKYYGSLSNQNNIGDSGFIYIDSYNETYKIEKYYQGYMTEKSVWTYDMKNNPEKNIKGYNKQPFIFGKNFNYLTTQNFDSYNNLISNFSYEYTYDSNDFPVSCIQNHYENGQLQSTFQTNYFY